MFPIRLWGGLLFLTNLSLVLTGFSSWIIGKENDINSNVNINVGEYKNYSNCFLFNKTEDSISNEGMYNYPTSFKYNDYGIVENGKIVKKGTIKFYLAVRLNGDNGIFENLLELPSQISFDVYFSSVGNFEILNYLSGASYIPKGSSKIDTAINTNNSEKNINISTSDSNLLSKQVLSYTILLDFDFTKVNNFKNEVADNLSSSRINTYIKYGG